MSGLIEECTEKLRVRTKYWLISSDNEVEKGLYPFREDTIPIMCSFTGAEGESFEAYESGNRSIVFKHRDAWFKAKGVGIPRGLSQPVFHNGRVYTYHLDGDLQMCHRSVLWGFMEKHDVERELSGAKAARQLGFNIEPIGYGTYKDVFYTTFKDRQEMFRFLKEGKGKTTLERFPKRSEKTTGYSFFSNIASDIRVQELLYTFMLPEASELLDEQNCVDYVRWLGSSCARSLKQLHDSGFLHGTWIGDRRTGIGLSDVHSNSYAGNHTIEEEGTGLVDFDLTEKSQDESLRKLEKWCLIHMENPLFYAGSYMKDEALDMGLVGKNVFREKLAASFESGVEEGYVGNAFALERSLSRDMLRRIVETKQAMWELYGLPKDLIGDIYFIDALVLKKSKGENELKKAASSIRV